MSQSNRESKIENFARVASDKAAVRRTTSVTWVLAGANTIYGFSSFGFINHFDNSVTLFSNVWPRVVFSVIPLLSLALYLRDGRSSDRFKLKAYCWGYSVIFFTAAWIHVWPIAISGRPEVLLYVGGVNTAYLCATWTVAAIPPAIIPHALSSILLFIVTPIVLIVVKSADVQIMTTVINDTAFALVTGLVCGYVASKLYGALEMARAKERLLSAEFLGDALDLAIFEGRKELLEEKEVDCYVLVLDIRDSSVFTRKYGDVWSVFNKEWLSVASDIVESSGGTYIKSTGDGLIACFGLFDEAVDLGDLPGLENRNEQANEVRWEYLTRDLICSIDRLMSEFIVLASKHFPNELVRIGCGVDRGPVGRGIRGGKGKRELDIWGDRINTAAKLESFSKYLTHEEFPKDSSLAIFSPYATDYLPSYTGFRRVDLKDDEAVRGAPGVKWVLVREYSTRRQQKSNPAA